MVCVTTCDSLAVPAELRRSTTTGTGSRRARAPAGADYGDLVMPREVRVARDLEAPAAEVSERIGDFYRLHEWHPMIAQTEPGPEPGLRVATMAGGHRVLERLVEEGATWQTYEPADDSMGLDGYRSTIRVTAVGPA